MGAMCRVAVIGCSGCGKSVLSRRLGGMLGIEVVHLDALYWRPGWVGTPREEWHALVDDLVARPTWILDGHYGSTLDVRLARADTVIFLDVPRRVRLWRVIGRWLAYRGRTRPDLAAGCPEHLDWAFLRWIWAFDRSRRPAILEKLEAIGSGKRVVVLRSSADVERFLRELAPGEARMPATR